MKKGLDKTSMFLYNKGQPAGCGGASHGGLAQLGERLNGIQEVSGSIPLISTKCALRHKKNLEIV